MEQHRSYKRNWSCGALDWQGWEWEEANREQWFKVLLQRTFFRAVVGRASFNCTGKARSWSWLPGAGRDLPALQLCREEHTHLCMTDTTDTAVRQKGSLSSCPPSVFTWLAWPTCSQKCPCLWTVQCSKGRRSLWCPPHHSEQQWWIPLCSAVVSVNSLCSKRSKHFSYALFAPPVAHRIILKQPVQARCAAIPQEPCPSAHCTAQVRTTHQGLVNSNLVNIQNKSACSVKRLKLVQFYTGTAPPSSTATH